MPSILPLPTGPTEVVIVPTNPATPTIGVPMTGPRGPQGATGVTGAVAAFAVQIALMDPVGPALVIRSGMAYYRVNAVINGLRLLSVALHVTTPSSSGSPAFQIHNDTKGWDLLSTPVSVDPAESDSVTASIPAVIDISSYHDVVSTADELRVDCIAAGVGTKGAIIDLTFG